MIYKMTLKDSTDEMTFDLLEVPIVDKDIEGAVDNVTLDGNQYTDYLWLKKQFIQKWSILCDDEYTRLRGFYTRQFENADVPSYRLYYGDDIIRNSTLSGERIELSISGVAGGTMSLTQMDGNIEQTTYTGKNLFNATGGTTTVNGVTFTKNADGTYKANGTSTGFIAYTIGKVTFTSATSVIYSGCPTNGSMSTYSLNLQKDDGAVWLADETGSGQTATLEANKAYSVRLVIRTGVTVNGIIYKPMVRLSSISDSSYEPYVGGIPAPNPSYPQPISTVTGRQTVEVVGKNLLEAKMPTTTYNGVTCTNNGDGSYTLNGTATAGADFRIDQSTAHGQDNLQNYDGTYTLSCDELQNDMQLIVMQNGTWSQPLKMRNSNTPATATFTKNGCFIYVYVAQGKTLNNLRIHPMLEKSATATAYEPYEGQDYEINLGKNLFDKDNAEILHAYNAGSSAVANERAWSVILKCEPSTEYTYSNVNSTTTMLNDSSIGFYATKPVGGTSIISRVVIGHNAASTFTTPATAEYMLIYYYWGGDQHESAYEQIQIEKGNQASSYSAYFEPIELCKIGTYQDRIYKENGKWWLHKEIGEVVFDGSENWSLLNSGSSNFYYNLPVFVTPKDQDIMPVSDYFVGTPITNGNTSVGLWITNAGTIRARKETEQTLAGFKTWLGTALPSVYYVLATPTTTEITNEEVLEGLEALLNEAISVGQHNIYTDTPNALPTLTFDLTEYLSQSTTIIPETAVRLTLTDGGVINACGCRKDVQLTMRETIE